MASASDRPLPFEAAEPELPADDENARTMTGVRRKSPSSEDLEVAPPTSTGPSPDSLRKPFAMLTSPGKMDSLPPPSGIRAQTPPGAKTPSESKRADTSDARRKNGVCTKHGIARSPSGSCLLCEKEAPRKSNALPYLVIGVVLVGGAIALVLFK